MTPEQFKWYMIVNTLVAIGTIGAVVVALFQTFWVKLWPPKLQFTLVNTTGEKTLYANPEPGEAPEVRYYHLRIQNLRRWSPAKDLSLHLIELHMWSIVAQGYERAWSGDVPIRCRHQELYPLKRTVGSAVDYDLCSISKERPTLAILPVIAPTNLTYQWQGQIRFLAFFQAKASECDSRVRRVIMSWDGKWEDGDAEMQKHFLLNILPS